ncbi:PulJ/GspJ family protein [Conservatibacter flavescens]|nr:type II secretion system protein J [Conservatibacter flavescens]
MNYRIYKGQTLLELMITLALSAFLLLMILSFYSQSQRQNQHILLQLQLQSEIHKMLQLMGKDLRRAGFRASHARVLESELGNNFFLFEQEGRHKSIAIHAMSQAEKNCVLFFYDGNADGCLGKHKSGICLDGASNATANIQQELFGYRLVNNMLQTRATYRNSVNQQCQQQECRSYLEAAACTANSGWTALLDEQDYVIDSLHFAWQGEKGVEIQLSGYLKAQPDIHYETSMLVPLLNE